MRPQVHPEDLYFSCRRGDQRQQHTDGGGFSRPILSKEAIYIRLLYGKGQGIDSFQLPKMLGKARNPDDRRHTLEYQRNLRRFGGLDANFFPADLQNPNVLSIFVPSSILRTIPLLNFIIPEKHLNI